MATARNFKERRLERHQEALVRQEERSQRGAPGQLSRLESRGFGHCAEAQELRKALSGGDPVPPREALEKE